MLGANSAQFAARLHQSEPPTQLIASDMLATGSNRTYLLGRFAEGWGARPGEGLYMSAAWRYYMVVLSNLKFTPEEFRANRQRFFTEFQAHLTNNPTWLAGDVKRLTQVSHLIVWDKIERGSSEVYPDDLLRSQLGAGWRKDSDEVFGGFDHWTWQKLFQVRRREYVRTGR